MLRQLHRRRVSPKMGVMPRENKTAHILWRVRPSFKKYVEAVADASGKHVSELLEDSVKLYAGQKEVREKMKAKPDTKPTDAGEG